MIEESDAGMGLTKPSTIDIQRQGNRGFAGGTGNRGVASGNYRLLFPIDSGYVSSEKNSGRRRDNRHIGKCRAQDLAGEAGTDTRAFAAIFD